MRDKTDPQALLFVAAIDLDARVRADHPLRTIKRMADEDLAKLSRRFDEPVFDATVFSHNRERLARHDLIAAFFDGTVRRAMAAGLVSPDHFSADESLIKAYASIKSFKSKDAKDGDDDDKSDGNSFMSSNAAVDFHGQKRSNGTHASTTDPDAKLIREGDGKPAILGHALRLLTKNRHGLVLAAR